MKVVLVCAAYPPLGKGGGPAASRTIAQAIGETHDVVVITVSDREEQWHDGSRKVISIGSPNVYWNYWKEHSAIAKVVWHLLENFNPVAFVRIRRLLKLERPDLVATVSVENVNVATWLAARMGGVPVAHFIQSYFLLCWKGSMFKCEKNCVRQCFSCRITTFGRKKLSALVDLVAAEAVSTLSLHFQHGYFKAAQSFVAPGMITEHFFQENRLNRKSALPLRVGYVGVLTFNKGVHIIARALKLIEKRDLIAVEIAGDGDKAYRALLEEEFAGLNVSFRGWVTPNDFYATIDVLIVPSIWREPFGRVCIEAMSAGVPVVASAIGGLETIVTNDQNGFLFEANNPASLANVLSRLVEGPHRIDEMKGDCLKNAQAYRLASVGPTIRNQLESLKKRKETR